jgi:hypothetical protein
MGSQRAKRTHPAHDVRTHMITASNVHWSTRLPKKASGALMSIAWLLAGVAGLPETNDINGCDNAAAIPHENRWKPGRVSHFSTCGAITPDRRLGSG